MYDGTIFIPKQHSLLYYNFKMFGLSLRRFEPSGSAELGSAWQTRKRQPSSRPPSYPAWRLSRWMSRFCPRQRWDVRMIISYWTSHTLTCLLISHENTHLQCTTMGPAYCGLHVLTFLRNLSMPMGVKGTPKSGQLVKWNCVTSRWGFLPDKSPT